MKNLSSPLRSTIKRLKKQGKEVPIELVKIYRERRKSDRQFKKEKKYWVFVLRKEEELND